MFFGGLNNCNLEADNLQKKAALSDKKKHLHFFTQKIDEADALYNLTKNDKARLWKNLLAAINHNKAPSECWTKVWRKFAQKNRVTLAVRYALKKYAAKGDKIARLSNAENELSQALKKSLRIADAHCTFDEAKPLKNQVQKLDESLLEYFKQNNSGLQANALIKALSSASPVLDFDKRVEKWKDPLYLPQLIARCRWSDCTRALVYAMEEKTPALANPIHQQLLGAQTRGNRLNDEGDGIIDMNGKRVIDFDSTAFIALETAKSVLLSAIPLFSSVTAYYVITWLLREVHKQFLMNYKNPRTIVLKGRAYERLGELSGAGTHPCTIDKIRKIIPALAGCLFKYRTNDRLGEGNFLSYRYERAINGSYSVLIIELQPLACPGFIASLPKGGLKFQEQRKAIPVTRPFPFYGNQKNSFSLQLRFQYALIQEMRNRAQELHRYGGISLDNELMADLALESQLSEETAASMIDYWVKEDCLALSKDGLYTLGNKESAARRMMEEAGKYETEGAAAGKKKLEKQRRKIAVAGKL